MEGYNVTQKEILRAICDNDKLKFCTILLEVNEKSFSFRLNIKRNACKKSGLGMLEREMIISTVEQLEHIKTIFHDN